MGSFRLHRRTLLRGVAGVALALPALEIMMPQGRARAAEPSPRRFFVAYGGISIGTTTNLVVPTASGADYALTRGLLPLGAGALPSNPGLGGEGLDVRDHVSVVSGLKIPWASGAEVPPGGRSVEFHGNTQGPQLSGMRGGSTQQEAPNGPTADQIAGKGLGGDRRVLSYRVQVASYEGTNGTVGDSARISWFRDEANVLRGIDPTFSPEQAYASLFDSFVGPEPSAAAVLLLERKRSVVDLVRHKAQRLSQRLGAADRIRLERHLDEVRALEDRLQTLQPMGGDCAKPPPVGADPAVGGAYEDWSSDGITPLGGAGHSDEDLRAELLTDLIVMAFACDLSRSAALRMTFSQCWMQATPLIGVAGDMHKFGHTAGSEAEVALADCVGWHVKHFARLITRLRDTEDLDGASLLDSTAAVLLFEGGRGYNPEADIQDSAHSTENMIALVGGHAGGLNAGGGQHIVKPDWHPANVVVSALSATGAIPDETLGEVSGRVPELFG